MGVVRQHHAHLPRLLPLLGCALLVGCLNGPMNRPPTPTEAGLHPASYADPSASPCTTPETTLAGLIRVGEAIRNAPRVGPPPPKRSILVLSGGGSYGAYSAGVLVGWTQSGTRPEFDVVTGVSTGAIIAVLAFLGPEYDCELQRVYTTLESRDIFRVKKSLRALLFSESVADTAPLGREILRLATPELLRQVAAEHARGRRLYVGTTDLDARRQVIWDMGAIATAGTEEARDLFIRVILASAAIPGFFPPVRVPVSIDGVGYEERHVDGGVSTALFFQPPFVPADCRTPDEFRSLLGSDLYIIVAGKLYADPEAVKLRAPTIAGSSISTLIYAQTRSNLNELYATAAVTGMYYHLAAIPPEFASPLAATTFDPVEMTRMFEEGVRRVADGTVWRGLPPGLGEGERTAVRTTTDLSLNPGAVGAAPDRRPGPRLLWPNWARRSIAWRPFNLPALTNPWGPIDPASATR